MSIWNFKKKWTKTMTMQFTLRDSWTEWHARYVNDKCNRFVKVIIYVHHNCLIKISTDDKMLIGAFLWEPEHALGKET